MFQPQNVKQRAKIHMGKTHAWGVAKPEKHRFRGKDEVTEGRIFWSQVCAFIVAILSLFIPIGGYSFYNLTWVKKLH